MNNKIELSSPIEIDGVHVSVVHMRVPKVRDHRIAMGIRKTGKSDEEVEIHMVATLCGIPLEKMDDIDFPDYFKMTRVLASFYSAPD